MWITILSTCFLATLASAEYLYDSDPYSHFGGYATAYDNYKPTNYKFEYGVSDPHTGDHKSQWEVKENGVVRGAYQLLEPDGTTRIVEYYADDTGFHADVKKIGHAVHDAPHYGELHHLADVHIADSLAYNGYGHGGVTHSYGAPIAAIPKIAAPAPVPEPIHAAPIAQVQHIEPVQQVIAPQIHHIGTPDHHDAYDIAPQYYEAPEAHYDSEKYFNGPILLQEPTPFKIPQYEEVKVVQKVPTPHIVHAPQLLKAYPTPIVKSYVEQPQIVAKEVITKEYAPQVVNYAQPGPEYYKPIIPQEQIQIPIHYSQPEPTLIKSYVPEALYAAPAPAPQPTAHIAPSPTPVIPVPVAKVSANVKVQSPIVRFFAPFAKYFAPPPPPTKQVPVVTTKVAPVPSPAPVPVIYASVPTKVYNDYDAYQGYKQEAVIVAPHNYLQSPQQYEYNHGY